MKKLIVLFSAFVFLAFSQAAFAYRASDFSSDSKIVSAITLLEQSGETDVLRNLQKYGIRVSFDDLTSYTYNASKAYAISTYNQYIILSKSYSSYCFVFNLIREKREILFFLFLFS